MTTTNRLVDNFSGLKHISLPVIGFPKPNSTNKIETKNIVDKKLFNRLALSLNEQTVQQPSESDKFVANKASELINAGKVSVKKTDVGKMTIFLTKNAAVNPKLTAAALYRPELAENRYDITRSMVNTLTDEQFKKLSNTEDGRKFLRTTAEIIANDAPIERSNRQDWMDFDTKLIGKSRDKMFEFSKKEMKDYYGKSFRDEFQNGVEQKSAVKADALINQGKITVKEIDQDKLMNVLTKEATKTPWTVTVAVYTPEVQQSGFGSYDFAKGIINRLSDDQLADLARTQPGRNMLNNFAGLIENNAPADRANYRGWQEIDGKALGRIKYAIINDDTQRENFKGITSDQLVQAMSHHNLSKERADELLPHLNQAMYEYKIDTPMKQAMFLAQVGVESAGLTDFTERAAKKNPNLHGGWYGRGAVQLTKEENYQNAESYFGIGLLDNKEKASDPRYTFQIDGWFSTKYDNRKVDKMVTGNPTTALTEFNSYLSTRQ
jgi:predicted chitinase